MRMESSSEKLFLEMMAKGPFNGAFWEGYHTGLPLST
jgi:hypothetical protein